MLLRNIKKHADKTCPAGFIALCSAFLLVLLLSTPPFSYAATKIVIDDNKSISMILGLRSNFSITEKGAPNGISSSKSFNIESMSIYLDSTFNDYIKMTLNAERNGDDRLRVLDAIAKFDFNDDFNLWFGRMHPTRAAFFLGKLPLHPCSRQSERPMRNQIRALKREVVLCPFLMGL